MNAVNIINALLVLFSIFMIYKSVKDSDTLVAKSISIMIWLCVILVLILYYLDLYNIPSRLMWNRNLNADTWLAGIFTLLSAFLGGGLLLIVTKWQIDVSEQKSIKRDKEENRLKNMPLLKYKFIDSYEDFSEFDEFLLHTKFDDTSYINFGLELRNIGLATIRKMKITAYGECIPKQKYEFYNNGVLQVGESNKIQISTILPEGEYDIYFDIIYQDILSNKYLQKIKMHVFSTNIHNNTGIVFSYKYKIMDPKNIIKIHKKID